jgi:hypothetical protein
MLLVHCCVCEFASRVRRCAMVLTGPVWHGPAPFVRQVLLDRLVAAQRVARSGRKYIWRYGDVGDSDDEKPAAALPSARR